MIFFWGGSWRTCKDDQVDVRDSADQWLNGTKKTKVILALVIPSKRQICKFFGCADLSNKLSLLPQCRRPGSGHFNGNGYVAIGSRMH